MKIADTRNTHRKNDMHYGKEKSGHLPVSGPFSAAEPARGGFRVGADDRNY